MIRAGTIAVAMLAMIGGAAADEAATPALATQPHQRIRALHALQDQIARGNLEAHNAQAALLKQLGDEFLQADPAVWKDERNARAVMILLLSGGPPQVAATLRAQKVLAIDEGLLDGAIAYIDGRLDEARARLGNLKPRELPPTIAAEIALVQSALAAPGDVATGIARLDEARLMMPGTLIEEAALRREIFIAGQGNDYDRFEALSLQYLRRFRQSIYSENFRQRLVRAVDRFGFAQQPERFPRLVALLDRLDGAERPALYLRIARAALLGGKVAMADLAAERAMTLTEDGSAARERARLYRAAARIVGHAHAEALLDLQAIAIERLSARDADILRAALAVGHSVRKANPVVSTRPDAPGADDVSLRPRIDFTPSRTIIRRAQALLDDSQRQLMQQEQ